MVPVPLWTLDDARMLKGNFVCLFIPLEYFHFSTFGFRLSYENNCILFLIELMHSPVQQITVEKNIVSAWTLLFLKKKKLPLIWNGLVCLGAYTSCVLSEWKSVTNWLNAVENDNLLVARNWKICTSPRTT